MNTLLFLLCVLMRQILGQTKDISPAKIFAQQKSISEGSDLYFTCSTFGSKKQTSVYVYLCKNGVGTEVKKQEKEKNDTPFTITGVGLHHSGNYSCIYSKTNSEPSTLRETGANHIQIDVIPSFLPAEIFLAGPSTITEGDRVQFRCTFTKSLQTLGGCELIQSHLRKKETLVQEQVFNVTRKEANFTVEGAAMRDSGPYSCVLLPSKCITENQRIFYGNNTVLIEVKESLPFRMMYYCGIVSLILLLGFSLWMINIKSGQMNARKDKVHKRHNLSLENQRTDTNVLEEQQDPGKDLESQKSGSLCKDENQDSDSDDNNPYYNDNEDGVYTFDDDPPTSTYTNAATCKTKWRAPEFSCSEKRK